MSSYPLSLLFPVIYVTFVFHVSQAWLGNKPFIDPIFRKPSFARYNQSLCVDVRSIDEEVSRFDSPALTPSKYYQQGRGVTRDMLHTAGVNYREKGDGGQANPSLAARASNRGLYHQ